MSPYFSASDWIKLSSLLSTLIFGSPTRKITRTPASLLVSLAQDSLIASLASLFATALVTTTSKRGLVYDSLHDSCDSLPSMRGLVSEQGRGEGWISVVTRWGRSSVGVWRVRSEGQP